MTYLLSIFPSIRLNKGRGLTHTQFSRERLRTDANNNYYSLINNSYSGGFAHQTRLYEQHNRYQERNRNHKTAPSIGKWTC